MKILDPRIRKEHVARYGTADEIEDYLRTLEGLLSYSHTMPVGYRAENHHMLARSVWPEYSNLTDNPWNRLRISRALHIALTELQSRFEERLRHAALLMKGQSAEAFLKNAQATGRMHKARGTGIFAPGMKGKGAKRRHELHPNLSSEIMKRTMKTHPTLLSDNGKRRHELHPHLASEMGKNQGKKNVDSGHLASISSTGGKVGGRIVCCLRWNIRRGRPCSCGRHR